MFFLKLKMIGQRILLAVPSLIGVIVVAFVLTRSLPGDPAVYFAGITADEESIAQIREQLGLDKSIFHQFIVYCKNLTQGNLGVSLNTGQSVASELSARFPASLELTLTGLALALMAAIPLGILAAVNPNTWIDHLCRIFVTAGASTPIFFSGLLLVFVFYYLLGWAPSPIGRLDFFYLSPPKVTGFYTIDAMINGDFETAAAAAKQLILPAITLAIFALAPIARMTRSAMLTAMGSEYVKAATANGIGRRKIIFVYALRNAMLPLLTIMGLVFSYLLGANVLVEKVFSWPGIGSFAVDALVASDFAAVQGFILVMAVMFVVLNLVIDILYTLVDPRVSIDG
ncbi:MULTISPECIES: ABC transporter permease [Reinekea]|uniref:ABC transporter permease n=1 Tax=Reinekea TaxID=230494 RepID=UPI001D05B646|nr:MULTISPECIES: ABC transporter permease [Reinekea]